MCVFGDILLAAGLYLAWPGPLSLRPSFFPFPGAGAPVHGRKMQGLRSLEADLAAAASAVDHGDLVGASVGRWRGLGRWASLCSIVGRETERPRQRQTQTERETPLKNQPLGFLRRQGPRDDKAASLESLAHRHLLPSWPRCPFPVSVSGGEHSACCSGHLVWAHDTSGLLRHWAGLL